eukprot:TRINITY_DN2166_c0_g1_i13.p1 TRINITY_DN2166_c0_g1~~TRINITY_DN2166_c0_g1_i13.p1  ORF type:complete len:421 (+),score=109.42 TRINITY_DN2166_c0_g1_i13:47-1264(+)
MSSDSGSDFDDFDFVSSACQSVGSKWSDPSLQSGKAGASGSITSAGAGATTASSSGTSTNLSNNQEATVAPSPSPSPSPSKQRRLSPCTRGTTRGRGRGKRRGGGASQSNENLSSPIVINDAEDIDDSQRTKENITPPPSPTGEVTPPVSSGRRGKGRGAKAVRGANRTKKTTQALERLEKRGEESNHELPPNNPILKLWNRAQKKKKGDSIVIEDEEEDDMDFVTCKVLWRTSVQKIEVRRTDKLGSIMDEFARKIDLKPGDIGFLVKKCDLGLGEDVVVEAEKGDLEVEDDLKWVSRNDSIESLDLPVTAIIEARLKNEMAGDCTDSDVIELKVQTKDRKGSVNIKIRMFEKMEELMNKYSQIKNIDLTKLKFFFDGEALDPEETAETLDLEGGECIDVHQVS